MCFVVDNRYSKLPYLNENSRNFFISLFSQLSYLLWFVLWSQIFIWFCSLKICAYCFSFFPTHDWKVFQTYEYFNYISQMQTLNLLNLVYACAVFFFLCMIRGLLIWVYTMYWILWLHLLPLSTMPRLKLMWYFISCLKVWAVADSKRQGYLGFNEFVTAMQVLYYFIWILLH